MSRGHDLYNGPAGGNSGGPRVPGVGGPKDHMLGREGLAGQMDQFTIAQ